MTHAIPSTVRRLAAVAFCALVLGMGTARVCAQDSMTLAHTGGPAIATTNLAYSGPPPLPMPVADPVEDTPLTNHICPPRLPVIFLSWNQTGQVARSWRIYTATNPLTLLSNYTFFAEVTTTQVPVMAQKPMEFFCVSAVRAYDGKESERVGMR